jgi:predicted house-cleaning noncanonical NTP pyrophosphatase (MazG superfamily)
MSKLVRDQVPDIIRAHGRQPIIRIADAAEYRQRLIEKLGEEADEVRDADDQHRPEELADVLEVVLALAADSGMSDDDLENLREAKAAERGGFERRIIWERNLEPGE